MSKSEKHTVVLDPEWQRKLDALPDARPGNPGHKWTDQEDEFLRQGWGKKRQMNLCEQLGLSLNTVRSRARALGIIQ